MAFELLARRLERGHALVQQGYLRAVCLYRCPPLTGLRQHSTARVAGGLAHLCQLRAQALCVLLRTLQSLLGLVEALQVDGDLVLGLAKAVLQAGARARQLPLQHAAIGPQCLDLVAHAGVFAGIVHRQRDVAGKRLALPKLDLRKGGALSGLCDEQQAHQRGVVTHWLDDQWAIGLAVHQPVHVARLLIVARLKYDSPGA